MGDYNEIRSHDIMSLSIYNFLENLLSAVHTSETLATEAQQCDQINVPGDIKPGGYPEGIFIFLSEREREEYMCSVCYSVIKDVHQCSNGHKFCYSCIYVWSTCNRSGADCCPACRCDGIYARNEQLNDRIGGKRVKCQDEGCNWRGFLRDFSEHDHRHYEFKELSRSIELPRLLGSESSNIVTPLLMSKSVEMDKTIVDRSPTIMDTFSHINSLPNIDSAILNSSVPRRNVAPRRLTRLSDSFPTSESLADTTNNPTSNVRITRSNSSSSNGLGSTGNNEASHSTPILSSLLDSSREHRSPLLPPINRNRRDNLTPVNQPLDYRRLAPTYASRRHNLGFFHDGHEHLATILILLTSDLEDRVTQSTHSRSSHLSQSSSDQSATNTLSESHRTSSMDTESNQNRNLNLFSELSYRFEENPDTRSDGMMLSTTDNNVSSSSRSSNGNESSNLNNSSDTES